MASGGDSRATLSSCPPPGSILSLKYKGNADNKDKNFWYFVIVPDEEELNRYAGKNSKRVDNTKLNKMLVR